MKPLDRETVDSILKFLLEQKEKNSPASYTSIKNALYKLSVPFSTVIIKKDTPLFRLRSHDSITLPFEQNVLHRISDIGPILDYTRILNFGRANEPLQSIFYCATDRKVAFCETSKIARHQQNISEEVYTISEWTTKRDIRIATLPTNELNQGKNKIADKFDSSFRELISEFRDKGSDLVEDFLNILSLEFSHKPTGSSNDYLISAAFANYIFDHGGFNHVSQSEEEVDGIVYPSVQNEEEGMNYAFKDSLILDRSIELRIAACQKLELISDNTFKETNTLASKSIDYDRWLINWK